MVHASVEHLEKHYADLSSKPFFRALAVPRASLICKAGLVKYMASGPVVAMVWEGKDVVKQGRAMLGATNPLASAPGTIRGDYAIDVGRVRHLVAAVRLTARRTSATARTRSSRPRRRLCVQRAARQADARQALWLCASGPLDDCSLAQPQRRHLAQACVGDLGLRCVSTRRELC